MSIRELFFTAASFTIFYLTLGLYYPTINKVDRELLISLSKYHNGFLDVFSLLLNQFGSQILWLAVALVFFIVRRRVWALTVILGLALDAVVANTLKLVVGRPRPVEVIESLRVLETGLGPSFPSGHAERAFLASVLLGGFRPRLRILWYAVAGLSSFARIYLGAHFPTDVMAGALNGVILGYTVLGLTKTRSFQRLVSIQIRKG